MRYSLLVFIALLLAPSLFGAPASTLYIEKNQGPGTNIILRATNSPSGSGLRMTNAAIESVHKRTVGATSHSYEPMRFHYGNPTNDAYWSWVVSSISNVNDVAGSFDHFLSWGFNSFSSPNYKTNLPTLTYGLEEQFITGPLIQQSEHYMSFAVNSTNTHQRPWGWAFNWTYPPTILHTWNVEQFEFNTGDFLPSLSIIQDPNHDQMAIMTFSRAGFLSFTGNTNYFQNGANLGGRSFIQESGVHLFGKDTNGFTFISGPQLGETNQISLFPALGNGSYSMNLNFGSTPNSGFRWSHLNSRMEYNLAGVWTPFNNNVFLAGITVSGGVSNVFTSPIRLAGADLWLNGSSSIFLGANAATTDKYQYIQGNVNGEPTTFGDFSTFIFKTGTSGSGGGTERFAVGSGGITNSILTVLKAGMKVGVANQATITNILSGSATLNFASQSLGGSEDLPITVTGAADGDAVSLGYESTVATGIIGSYSAWASNGVVFVRFIATAATQNPNSGVFKVVVTKFQ